MWSKTEIDAEGNEKVTNFAGTQNVWIKRIGFFILVVGLFPSLLTTYAEELDFIWKFIIYSAIASYGFYHVRGFIKSIFGSKA